MKETIYTIPINEAYDTDSECPLCHLEKQLEQEAVEYALGPAMMEPDFRINSNEKGFCNHHFDAMFHSEKKLPLALILDTHLDEVLKKLDNFSALKENLKSEKKGLFKKSTTTDEIAPLKDMCQNLQKTCVVCEKIEYTMARYIDTLLYMWATDNEFRIKFDNSKGVCMKHFSMLLDRATEELKDNDARAFVSNLIDKEEKELSRIKEDIHKFTLKFDYRNRDMEWGTAKDAPIRTIEKLSGYIKGDA